MDRRQWLNLGLLALVVTLGMVAWYEADRAPRNAPQLLTQLIPDQVNKIEISRRHSDPIILTGSAGKWWVKEPVRVEAHRFQIENVLRLLSAESLSRFPAAGKDLEAYGLKEPAVRARFNDIEVIFGGMTPVDQRRYVQVGDTVHLITDAFSLDLMADLSAFVSRNLVPESRQIEALTAPDFSLKKAANGRWQATPPDKFKGADAVQSVLDAWQNTQALRLGAYHRAPPLGEVTIALAGRDEALRYVITAKGDEWVLARPDVSLQYHLTGEQMSRLLGNVKDEAENKVKGDGVTATHD